MTRQLSENALQSRLAELILSLPPVEAESVRFSLEGHVLVMEGRVPSYEAKCKMVHAAQEFGFQIQNCLRVTPGLIFSSSPSPAPANVPPGRPVTV
jgi:hypothetical protein